MKKKDKKVQNKKREWIKKLEASQKSRWDKKDIFSFFWERYFATFDENFNKRDKILKLYKNFILLKFLNKKNLINKNSLIDF